MENIIIEIAKTPLPTLLVMAGILFLFLAIVGKFGASIVVSPQKQKVAGVLGTLLLLGGIILYIQRSSAPIAQKDQQAPPAPSDQPSKPVPKEPEQSLRIPPSDTPSITVLKDKIHAIDVQIQKIEEELTEIPSPPALLHELEQFRQEHEEHLLDIENRLVKFNLALEELRPHRSVDLGARESIQKMENETIPDLDIEKRDVQQQLEKLQKEIQAAQKRVELEKRIHELKIRKQMVQEELSRSVGQMEPIR